MSTSHREWPSVSPRVTRMPDVVQGAVQLADEDEHEDWRSALEFLRTYTQVPGNLLANRVLGLHLKYDRRSLLLSSKMLSSALQIRGVQVWFGALGLAALALAVNGAVRSPNSQLLANRSDPSLTRARSTSVRFEASDAMSEMEKRMDSAEQAAQTRSYSFGLLLNGCPLSTSNATISFEGAAQVFTFSEPIEYNGLFVSKSARACAGNLTHTFSDSLTFRVSGSCDGGAYVPIAISGQCGWQREVMSRSHARACALVRELIITLMRYAGQHISCFCFHRNEGTETRKMYV